MADLLDAYGIPAQVAPYMQVPVPFELSLWPRADKDAIIAADMEKVKLWENAFSNFFNEYNEMANNWRLIVQKRNRLGLPVAKTSETTRATNTLTNLEFKILTSADPYIIPRADGLKEAGTEATEDELFAV